jgi:hypothetical protein
MYADALTACDRRFDPITPMPISNKAPASSVAEKANGGRSVSEPKRFAPATPSTVMK